MAGPSRSNSCDLKPLRGLSISEKCDKVRLEVLRCMTTCATMCDMAETRSRSIRVADDVWEAIQKLPGKTDDALRAVLVAKAPRVDEHGEVGRWFRETWKRLDEILEHVQTVEPQEFIERQVPSMAPPVSVVVPGFPIQCRHCGERGQGATKFATICFGCKGAGHSNLPSECPVCTLGGTGGL